jgi:hypothetical protein
MREKDLKALVHGFLAVVAFAELFNSKTRARKFMVGCAAGWHAHATFYHAVLEKDNAHNSPQDRELHSRRR